MKSALILFVKYPEPGKVKSRLAESIGAVEATKLYKSWVESIVKEANLLKDTDVFIYFPGRQHLVMMKNWLGKILNYGIQTGNDLGERMFNAFKELMSDGYEKVIIAGSDIPDLNRKIFTEAFNSLSKNEVVIGKAHDGGYYLIGLKKIYKELFAGIEWSNPDVLNHTVSKCKSLGLRYFLMEKLTDIDTLHDLINWKQKSKSNKSIHHELL